ncbi:hypothetical protein, partial [Mycobacterium tuberculosis]|uniref:hypothetical protein n=1 Tax=Mycobacterium tuberculosis TaxID=1773 RepID=UPI00207A21F4
KAWNAMQVNAGFGPQADQMQKMLADNRRDLARLNALEASKDPLARNPMVISALEKDVKERSAKIKALATDLIKERKDAEVEAAEDASVDYLQRTDAIIDSQASKEQKKKDEIARI